MNNDDGDNRRRRRRWEDLDPDILKRIFSSVPYEQLFLTISLVCSSWQSACLDLAFWSRHVLDLTAATAGFGFFSILDDLYSTNAAAGSGYLLYGCPALMSKFDSTHKYARMSSILSTLLRRIMSGNDAYGRSLDEWRMSVHTLIVPYDLPISDTHLLHLAHALPALRSLILRGATKVTPQGLEAAAKIWKLLKTVLFGPVSFSKDGSKLHTYDRFIQVLGRHCHQLEELHIVRSCFLLHSRRCLLIARNLPTLKNLVVEMPYIFRDGMLILLNKCPQLEAVQLYLGYFMLDEFDCDDGWIRRKSSRSLTFEFRFQRGHDSKWIGKCATLYEISPGLQSIFEMYDATPVVEIRGREWLMKLVEERDRCFGKKSVAASLF